MPAGIDRGAETSPNVIQAKAGSLAPWLTLAGVVLLLIGLAWDAALHAADEDLAAEEGIFTLSNPGHVLFAAGIALILAGSVAFLYGRYADRGRLLALAPAAGLLALAGVSFGWALSVDDGLGSGHSDDAAQASVEGEHSHDEGEPSESHVALLGAGDPAVEEELRARSLRDAHRLADFSVAQAEGFEQVTPFLYETWGPVHFRNTAYQLDGATLDSDRPEYAVYIKTRDGRMILAGVMYVAHTSQVDPEGGLEWHTHESGCIGPTGAHLIETNGLCPPGAIKISDQTAMLHVWFFNHPGGLLAHTLTPAATEVALEELT